MTLLLKCNDLAETRAYYSGVLGFEVEDTPEETCSARKAGGTLVFTAQDLWPGPPQCTGTIYFFISDVDGYYGTVKDRASVSWPPQDMPYGLREFGIRDCNGYALAFAQRN